MHDWGEGILMKSDIKGFFDEMDPDLTLEIAKEYLGKYRFLKKYKNLLRRRFGTGLLPWGNTEQFLIDMGSGQGLRLSTILAKIITDEILIIANEIKGARVRLYSDEFIILCRNKDVSREVLGVIAENLNKYQLRLSMDKTKWLTFGRKKNTTAKFIVTPLKCANS